jgi:hypothetical protein
MNYINIEGGGSKITFTNIGDLEEFDFNLDDLNEKADIEAVFGELDAYAQSSEIDLSCDTKQCRVINPEEIEYLSIQRDEEEEKELTLDEFELINLPLSDIEELIESSEVGDTIYLRVEHGNFLFRIETEDSDVGLKLGYFDCSNDLSNFDLLAKDYYSNVCDSLVPDYLVKKSSAILDEYKFEPNIIYAKLFRVIYNEDSNTKVLEKVETPAYYFLDDTRIIDEL